MLSAELGDVVEDWGVWSLRPVLLRQRRREKVRGLRLRKRAWPYAWLTRFPYPVSQQDDVLASWVTENQRVALGRVGDSPIARPSYVGFSPKLAADIYRSASELGHEVLSRAPGLIAHVTPQSLYKLIFEAQAWINVMMRFLEQTQPRCVLVATQHGREARILIAAARMSEIPSAYVPHAPFASNLYYADLPFDRALLRGDREKTAYVDLGADPSGMSIIGNLSVAGRRAPRSERVVVAPSPWRPDRLEAFFAVIREATFGEYVVCLHPRLDRDDVVGLVPSGTRSLMMFAPANTCSSMVALWSRAAVVSLLKRCSWGARSSICRSTVRLPRIPVLRNHTSYQRTGLQASKERSSEHEKRPMKSCEALIGGLGGGVRTTAQRRNGGSTSNWRMSRSGIDPC